MSLSLQNTPAEKLVTELVGEGDKLATHFSLLPSSKRDELKIVVDMLLSKLDEHSSRLGKMIRLRFCFNGDEKTPSYRMIGEKFGVTQERVRQLINQSYRFLRNPSLLSLLNDFFPEDIKIKAPVRRSIHEIRLIELDFSVRTKTNLRKVLKEDYESITIAAFVENYSVAYLLTYRNLGKKTIREINGNLEYFDLKLKE
jgi:hypothetical protein